MASIASLVVNIAADTAELRRNMLRAGQSVERFGQRFAAVNTVTTAIGTGIGHTVANIATNIARDLVGSLDDAIDRGAQLSTIAGSFNDLAVAAGGAAPMLDALRGSTAGLVTDLDLMGSANKALMLGLPVTATDMGVLAETATTLGRAMGLDATTSLNDLITALGRSSPMILDNLGLTVKVGEANRIYAAKIGTVAKELTDAQKKTAFYDAAMTAAKAKVAELGGVNLTLSDRLVQVRTSLENVINSIMRGIQESPVFTAALAGIQAAFVGAFGTDTRGIVDWMIDWIERLAIKAVDLGGTMLRTAGRVVEGFTVIASAVNRLLVTPIMTGSIKVGEALVFMAQMAEKLPFGEALAPVSGWLQGVVENMRVMRDSFAELTPDYLAEFWGGPWLERSGAFMGQLAEKMRAADEAAGSFTARTAAAAVAESALHQQAAAVNTTLDTQTNLLGSAADGMAHLANVSIPTLAAATATIAAPAPRGPAPTFRQGGAPMTVSVGDLNALRQLHGGPGSLEQLLAPIRQYLPGAGGFGGGGRPINITQNSLVNDARAKDELRAMIAEVMTDGMRGTGHRLRTA